MPSKSKRQHDFMEVVANDPKFAREVGVPLSVGKEFVAADKHKRSTRIERAVNTAKARMRGAIG